MKSKLVGVRSEVKSKKVGELVEEHVDGTKGYSVQ